MERFRSASFATVLAGFRELRVRLGLVEASLSAMSGIVCALGAVAIDTSTTAVDSSAVMSLVAFLRTIIKSLDWNVLLTILSFKHDGGHIARLCYDWIDGLTLNCINHFLCYQTNALVCATESAGIQFWVFANDHTLRDDNPSINHHIA